MTHVHGPDSEEHAAEVAVFDRAVERLLRTLPDGGDTLFLLTADHGHIRTDSDHEISLNDQPDILALLRAYPGGERRAAYLYAQPGQAQRLADTARDRLGECAVVLTRQETEDLALFGPRPLSPRAASRVGDVLLLPRANLQLSYTPPLDDISEEMRLPPPPAFRGMHGGLSPEEALIPLLALRV